jgi:hypothetical protein
MKIPLKILAAIALYYEGRRSQYEPVAVEGHEIKVQKYNADIKWDKDSSLALINKACDKKWGFSAIAGTFWLTKGKKTYKIEEGTLKGFLAAHLD